MTINIHWILQPAQSMKRSAPRVHDGTWKRQRVVEMFNENNTDPLYCSHCGVTFLQSRTVRSHYETFWRKESGAWTITEGGQPLVPIEVSQIPYLREQPTVSPIWDRVLQAIPNPSVDEHKELFRRYLLTGKRANNGENNNGEDDSTSESGDDSRECGHRFDWADELTPRMDRAFGVEVQSRKEIPAPSRWRAPSLWRPMRYLFALLLTLWSLRYNVSRSAMEILFTVLDGGAWGPPKLPGDPPLTTHNIRGALGIDKHDFHEYAICTRCGHLYDVDTLSSRRLRCTWKLRGRFGKCDGEVCTRVVVNGEVRFVPRWIYAYQSIRQQIASMLQRPGFEDRCELWRKRDVREGQLFDVYDGAIWREFNTGPNPARERSGGAAGFKPTEQRGHRVPARHQRVGFDTVPCDWSNTDEAKATFFSKTGRYGLMLNVDGFQPYSDSPYTLTAIYLTWLNLPMADRYKPENVMLVGLVPDTKGLKDDHSEVYNGYLRPLVDELCCMWPTCDMERTHNHPKGTEIGIALLCVACDLPAARKVGGFVGHGAKRGCHRCKTTFETVDMDNGGPPRVTHGDFNVDEWEPQTEQDVRRHAAKFRSLPNVTQKKRYASNNGVRYTELLRLPYFDPVRMLIVDPMHCLFMGLAKSLFKRLLEVGVLTEDILREMQKGMDSMDVPTDIGRIPRKMQSRMSKLTASQWKNLLIIYARTVMRGHVWSSDETDPSRDEPIDPDKAAYRLVQMLSCICDGFSRCNQTRSNVERTHALLLQYCALYLRAFGAEGCTINTHVACHLRICIIDYGSVSAFWLFGFERQNGIIQHYNSNCFNPASQAMKCFMMRQTLLMHDVHMEDGAYRLSSHKLLCDVGASVGFSLSPSTRTRNICSDEQWCDVMTMFLVVGSRLMLQNCVTVNGRNRVRKNVDGVRSKSAGETWLIDADPYNSIVSTLREEYCVGAARLHVEGRHAREWLDQYVQCFSRCTYFGNVYGSFHAGQTNANVLVMEQHTSSDGTVAVRLRAGLVQEYVVINSTLPACSEATYRRATSLDLHGGLLSEQHRRVSQRLVEKSYEVVQHTFAVVKWYRRCQGVGDGALSVATEQIDDAAVVTASNLDIFDLVCDNVWEDVHRSSELVPVQRLARKFCKYTYTDERGRTVFHAVAVPRRWTGTHTHTS